MYSILSFYFTDLFLLFDWSASGEPQKKKVFYFMRLKWGLLSRKAFCHTWHEANWGQKNMVNLKLELHKKKIKKGRIYKGSIEKTFRFRLKVNILNCSVLDSDVETGLERDLGLMTLPFSRNVTTWWFWGTFQEEFYCQLCSKSNKFSALMILMKNSNVAVLYGHQ